MSDATKGDEKGADAKPKRNKLLPVLVGVGILLLGGGAGAVLAPKFMAAPAGGKPHAEADSEAESEHGAAEGEAESEADEDESKKKSSAKEEPPLSVEWPPLVVDVRDEGGAAHHLKVVVTIECKDEHAEKAVQGFSFRARAKVLEYIRGQPYEELTDGHKFAELQTQIQKLVKESAGKYAKNVWITDFVAQ
jgi:flagellar basal body-associated protein FliL